jgi:Domain of unknown function (DUF4136)
MRSSDLPYFRLVVALLFFTFNCAAQKVTITADNRFDFKGAKRYAWGQNHIVTRQGRANDAVIDQKIVQEVNQTLAAKGFVEDPTNPDFYISYDAGSSGSSIKMEGAYSPATPASTASLGPVYGIPQNVWYSIDGHITFNIADAKSNRPVWAALATKKFRDPHKGMKNMPKQVEQIVSKSFRKFPPGDSPKG